jgi:hypothetical protein
MLTIDDVRAIPLFSTVAAAELERLAKNSADLHLAAGEFAVHEGGDRALYAVLSGKIQVVKLIDGIEKRWVGARRDRSSAKCRLPSVRRSWAATARRNLRGSFAWMRRSITPLRLLRRRSP